MPVSALRRTSALDELTRGDCRPASPRVRTLVSPRILSPIARWSSWSPRPYARKPSRRLGAELPHQTAVVVESASRASRKSTVVRKSTRCYMSNARPRRVLPSGKGRIDVEVDWRGRPQRHRTAQSAAKRWSDSGSRWIGAGATAPSALQAFRLPLTVIPPTDRQPAFVLHRRAFRESSVRSSNCSPATSAGSAAWCVVPRARVGRRPEIEPFGELAVTWRGRGELVTVHSLRIGATRGG